MSVCLCVCCPLPIRFFSRGLIGPQVIWSGCPSQWHQYLMSFTMASYKSRNLPKIVSVRLSASVERFLVSRLGDFSQNTLLDLYKSSNNGPTQFFWLSVYWLCIIQRTIHKDKRSSGSLPAFHSDHMLFAPVNVEVRWLPVILQWPHLWNLRS